MENEVLKQEIFELFNKIEKNFLKEEDILKLYMKKLYAEISSLLNIYEIEYSKNVLMDLVNTYLFYQGKARLNIYKHEIQNINEYLYNFFDRGLVKGFNELECNNKVGGYLDNISKLNNKTTYNDIFVSIRKVILDEFNIENQQFLFQFDNIVNTNKSLLESEVSRIRMENISSCKKIGESITKLGKTNTKINLNIDEQIKLIEKYLLNINKKNQVINRDRLNELLNLELKNFVMNINSLTNNIKDKPIFIDEIKGIFQKELESTYINFYNYLDENLIHSIVNETLLIFKLNKASNLSRNNNIMTLIHNFSNDFDLIDMDIVFANIEILLMTKYGLSRSHPSFVKVSNMMNLEKTKFENQVQGLESQILFGIIIELQSQIDKILNNKTVDNKKY